MFTVAELKAMRIGLWSKKNFEEHCEWLAEAWKAEQQREKNGKNDDRMDAKGVEPSARVHEGK